MSAPLIRLRGVAFAYPGRDPVFEGLDFELSPGARVGLVGGVGAGKTTLLHLIVGLLRPSAGEVEAFGQVRREDKDFLEVRRRAGLLFQDPDDQLFCPTVLEDVAFGPLNLGKEREEALDIARGALEAVGLRGYEDRVCYRLSGGEKRLASLAGVLAMQPDALLLDEPFNALDEDHVERVLSVLADLPQAMLIVSHHMDHLRSATDSAWRLSRGRLESIEDWR